MLYLGPLAVSSLAQPPRIGLIGSRERLRGRSPVRSPSASRRSAAARLPAARFASAASASALMRSCVHG